MPSRKTFFAPNSRRRVHFIPGSTGTLACARCTPAFKLLAIATFFVAAFLPLSPFASAAPASLRIYFIDVEGGQATLFVTPGGQSLLIDTGWPGSDNRDAGRIVAAAKDAGISRLDYVLITHYHADHVGGVPQLAERIPIGTFIDHGENHEPDSQFTREFYDTYQQLLASGKFQHIIAKVGDVLPLKGLRAEIVSSNGEVLQKPLPGAGRPNGPACKTFNPPADTSENHYSVGTFLQFGKLRILDLGDLTADKEKDLMCPVNRLGRMDIYIASHHGNDQSGSILLVHPIAPRVSIVENGAQKGGSPLALQLMKTSPKPKDIWQLHYSEEAKGNNTAAEFVANPPGPDAGNYLKLIAHQDGAFEIFNSRTKETRQYSPGR